jgi:hypothetical protein
MAKLDEDVACARARIFRRVNVTTSARARSSHTVRACRLAPPRQK